MSERQNSDREYLSRSPARTDRPAGYPREEVLQPQHTERQLHEDSPTRHDVEFYVRKVNRYEAEITRLEHDLSVAKFRLSKADDIEIKYDILFRENQKTVADCIEAREALENTRKELDRTQIDHAQSTQLVKSLKADLEAEKRNSQDLRQKKEQLRTKTTNQGQQEREALKESFTKELNTLRQENKDITQRFNRQISELKGTISHKEVIESALAAKLQHIKSQKNAEISRLKELIVGLKDELGTTHCQNEDHARKARSDLISETEDRILNVRKLAQLIEDTLMQEINNLNNTLKKKNDEINFLIECDKRQLEDHENSENNYRRLVAKLEEKIFTIQRENELQLYQTIERLKNQYNDNMAKARDEWESIRVAHSLAVEAFKKEITDCRREMDVMNIENKTLEDKNRRMAEEHSGTMQMLSSANLALQEQMGEQLRNYTTSMRQIEDDAATKLGDLHNAIKNKNTENEILNAQIKLKNGQIQHLLEEMDRLREVNREKLKKLESTNAGEQDTLNNQISDLKKNVLQLKGKIHELQGKVADDEAAHQLESELLKAELQSQKQANQLLKARNKFLNEWCDQLDRDLKAERVANVNILHDHSITHRENVQVREEVRVELEALMRKQIEQRDNVHKLEKARLEGDLNRKEHELREKKEELGRLLVQYKALQAKMGKSSKVDRSAEDEGKCRATLEAEILLTQNIFNAINRQ